MVSLARSSYYLDDWDRIDDAYSNYIANHRQQIDTLDQWLEKQPHLPSIPRSSIAILYNLAGASTEAAKELADYYFTLKTRNPDFFTRRYNNQTKAEQQLDLVEIAAMEPWELTLDGYRLSIVRLIDTDSSKVDFHQAMQIVSAALDFEYARIGVYVKGIVGVLDMAGFHLGYLSRINIMTVAVTLKYIQLFEKKVKMVHIVNCNGLISQVMHLIRPFLSRDLANKLHFHTPNEMEQFYKYIPREYLPVDYGGTLPQMSEFNAQFRKRFRSSEEWLRELDSPRWRTKENLRVTKGGQEEMKGSFRQLDID